MKTTFNISHFSAQNTPSWAQATGDISFILGIIGIVILTIQQNLPAGMVMPHFLIVISQWDALGGIIIKAITKFMGNVDDQGLPVNPNPPGK